MAEAFPDASIQPFGALDDGTQVERIVLANRNGLTATVMTLGATLQSLVVPDRDGQAADIVLGYDTPTEYLANPQYFGVTVGRYANRIARGRFELDGRVYHLETNDGPNHLHGGANGFDKRIWSIVSANASEVVLAYRSPDGEGGYPGTLDVTARFALDDSNRLTIEYRATTDAPTIVNITNHALFNLGGGGSALDHRLTLHADRFTPVDATLIPTGELAPVAGTPFDFRNGAVVGARIRDARDAQIGIGRGYDHNFVIDGEPGTLRPALRLEEPVSGRMLEMAVTAPGLQLYSGNFFDGTAIGKGGQAYRQGDGLAFEPQHFPDAPNQPGFPSARLDPGADYVNAIELRFASARSGDERPR